MDDRRLSTRVIAARAGISQERADHILRNELEMSKVFARWVPRLLTHDQMRTSATLSWDNLTLMQQDPESFLARFVAMDETWFHHFHPETKEQWKQWKHSNSPTPQNGQGDNLGR